MTAVVRPTGEAELAQVLAAAKRARLVGGGTSTRATPEGAATISLADLTGLVEHRPTDLVATARAGTPLADVNDALASHGQRFPLEPPDPGGRGTVGGVFAAGADGLLGTRGWRARDILLGARAVLPNGDRVRVGSSVVKSVAGFDVCKALVGSRGRLAALAEVTFRVEALPDATATAVRPCSSQQELEAACDAVDRLALTPRGFVVHDRRVFVRLEGPRQAVEKAVARLGDAGFASAAADAFEVARDRLLHPTVFAGPGSRRPPLDGFVDVARRQAFALHAPSGGGAAPRPLWEAVRRAFDPEGKLAP